MEKISVRFTGKLADSGRLHFYEYGRYQYANARFISTIEHFRRTGKVANRITGSAKIELYVEPAEQGSFVESIVIPALQSGAATAISTPLTPLIAYIWHLLVPLSFQTENDIVKIAQIRADEESIRSREETERTRELRKIVEAGATSTNKALDLVSWALGAGNTRLGGEGLLAPRLLEMKQELDDAQSRESLFAQNHEELSRVGTDDLQKLLSRTASIVPEMAVPMNRSADSAVFSSSHATLPVLRLDQRTAQIISAKKISPEVHHLLGRVRAYDVDIGVGKFVSSQFERPLNFTVPQATREFWKDTILEAMKKSEVSLFAQKYLDQAGLPTSLLFNSILTE
ncbi:hypothetical protein [Maritalea sp.]|uniref:hypothetical protein n=1 Tax=Maritalea sp. TaxID=2003361 RepID=UPI003EF3A43E